MSLVFSLNVCGFTSLVNCFDALHFKTESQLIVDGQSIFIYVLFSFFLRDSYVFVGDFNRRKTWGSCILLLIITFDVVTHINQYCFMQFDEYNNYIDNIIMITLFRCGTSRLAP